MISCKECRKNSKDICALGLPNCERGFPCDPTPTRAEYEKTIDDFIDLIHDIRKELNSKKQGD